MTNFKSLLASKTFWGAIIALLSGVANVFGYNLNAEDQGALLAHVNEIAVIVGSLFAIYGRIAATKRIG